MVNKNKYRFIKEVIEDKLKVFRIDEKVVNDNLTKAKYDLIDDKYDYLLNINIRKFNKQEIQKLIKVIEDLIKQIDYYEKTTGKDMWKHELHKLKLNIE